MKTPALRRVADWRWAAGGLRPRAEPPSSVSLAIRPVPLAGRIIAGFQARLKSAQGAKGGRRLILAALIAASVAALIPTATLAWDGQADRLVADLAYARLTPGARSAVDGLLAASGPIGTRGCRVATLADAIGLVDCLHDSSDDVLKDVMFDPIPLCGPRPPDLCGKLRCASAEAKRALAILKDRSAPAPTRAFALERLVYFIAELHQPLHAADDGDRSGERVRVTLPGSTDRRLTLMDVWDQYLVAEAVGTEETGRPYLAAEAAAHGSDWTAGDIDAWVADSHRVAVDDVYGRLPDPPVCGKAIDRVEALGPGYVQGSTLVVRAQLAKAGVRLAALLNAALS